MNEPMMTIEYDADGTPRRRFVVPFADAAAAAAHRPAQKRVRLARLFGSRSERPLPSAAPVGSPA